MPTGSDANCVLLTFVCDRQKNKKQWARVYDRLSLLGIG